MSVGTRVKFLGEDVGTRVKKYDTQERLECRATSWHCENFTRNGKVQIDLKLS